MLNDKQRIEHMIEAADFLIQFAADTSAEEYAASIEKQYALKFAFVMLGEDAALLSEELKKQYCDIPWRQIKATRNIVVHNYIKTDEDLLWETILTDIPVLRKRLVEIHGEL